MKAIEIISIPVTDQEKSKAFYLKLGFILIAETVFQGDQKWIQLGLPGDGPSITLVTWFQNMPPGCISGFVIKSDDLESDMENFNGKGIKTGNIQKTPWGRFMSVKDPDDNELSFHQK